MLLINSLFTVVCFQRWDVAAKTQIKKISKLYHKDTRKAEAEKTKEVCHVLVEQ